VEPRDGTHETAGTRESHDNTEENHTQQAQDIHANESEARFSQALIAQTTNSSSLVSGADLVRRAEGFRLPRPCVATIEERCYGAGAGAEGSDQTRRGTV